MHTYLKKIGRKNMAESYEVFLDELKTLNFTVDDPSSVVPSAIEVLKNNIDNLYDEQGYVNLYNKLATGDPTVAPEARRTLTGFLAALKAETLIAQGFVLPDGSPDFSLFPSGNEDDMIDAFITVFKELHGMGDFSDGLTDGAWEDLVGIIGQRPAFVDEPAFFEEVMRGSFNQFITTFPFPFGQSEDGQELLDAYGEWNTSRTTLSEDFGADFVNLTAYEMIYKEFVPGATDTEYKERLVNFVLQIYDENGYFLPSHFMDRWLEEVQLDAVLAVGEISSVTGTKSNETRVLFELFKLLVDLIEVLQKVAATQGERLTFYANYQKAYTNNITEIPVFSKSSFAKMGTSDEKFNLLLNNLSSKTQSLTETLRSYRGVIGDEAKQHQTVVNQSNEVVNQQTNLGTSILQQMSTILTSIFK